MVAIVTGKGTGLERSSAFVLGSQGQIGSALLGRDGEGVYVNAANGNLVITRQDEFLIGLGPDISAGRTYNSQGLTDGDNNDGWRASAYRTVTGLSGTYGAAGTTVTRTDWDGSATLYSWDAAYVTPDNITGAYVAKDGSGAYDTLTRSGTTWTWFDGSTKLKETYNESNGGRIAQATDTDNNLVDYTFDGNGRIASVKTYNLAGTGDDETVTYSYTGANLTQIVTSKNGGASTLTRVRYAYENYDSGTKTRLTGVTVDLSPNDNVVGDNYTYTTSYTYKDNVSALVASIGQTDGSLLQIQYDGSNRVSSFTQTIAAGVTRTTSFEYASGGRTIITDPAGQKTVMVHDVSTSDLLQITHPPESNNVPARTVQFAYNANGDVKSVAHGPGNVVTYEYDTHGNRTLDRDSAGNTVERTFSSKNELRRETRYLVADPDGAGAGTPSSAVTTRYAFDDKSHLLFEVSAEGFVTEHRYDNEGRRTVTLAYAGTAYDVSALAPTALIERGPLDSWVTNLATKANALRTERTYDFRGNLTKVFSHETLQADGTFLQTSAKTETLYVYDQAGLLLQRTVTNPQAAGTLTESFVYDGLNRMTLATDFYSNVTRTTFLDNRSQTVVTHANGLSSITTFNRGGEIISSSTSNAGANLVDLSGWPGNTQSPPAGNASVPGWLNYGDFINETAWATTTGPDGLPVVAMRAGQTDAALEGGGNFTNEIEIDGAKAYEFTYYFKLSDLNKHAIYFGLSQGAYVEYAATGADEGNPYFFSSWHTGQEATFTADTWYKVVGYVLPQGAAAPASPLGGVYNAETGAKVADATTFRWNAERANNSVHSRFFNYYGEANQQYSSYFYQPEIRQVTVPGVTAPDVQTRQYRYDNLGRLRLTVDPTGRREFFLYDTANRRVANVDNDGTVTEYRYDGNDNVTSTTRYNNRLTALQLDTLEITDQPITLNPTASNMVGNGSFETSGSYTTITDGRSNTTLPGWTDANGAPFEQIISGHLGVNASNGAYWLDLDSLASNGYTATGSNLLNNGSIDASGAYSTFADGRSNTTLPGWTDANGAPFEQITSGHLGVNASNGAFWLDMDSRVDSGHAATGSNLLSNASFDTSGSYTTITDGRSNPTLPGWTDANGNAFEQITSGHLGVNAANGAYWLDMDSQALTGYAATGSNLLTNGSFDTSGSYTSIGIGRSNTTLPGWTDANGRPLEQIASGQLGVNASNGAYWLDMDSLANSGHTATGPNLLTNGSFETSGSYVTVADGRSNANLPGWYDFHGTPFHQVTSGQLGVSASDGSYWLELEAARNEGGAVSVGSNLIVNGSFEIVDEGAWLGDYGLESFYLPGWTMPGDMVIEQIHSGDLGIDASDGDYWLDLEGYFVTSAPPTKGGGGGVYTPYTPVAMVSQSIGGLAEGQIMNLSFDHANRTTAESGSFQVYWNSALIATIDSTDTTMTTEHYEVLAQAGDNVLTFAPSDGFSDGEGASIDNVQLYATALNGMGGNMQILQTVGGRTAGEVLQLEFDTANRTTAASGSFNVYWNGTLIDTVTNTGTTMVPKAYQVTAIAGNNVLCFDGVGTVDGAGASIDNVRLFATTSNGSSGGNNDISQTVTGRTAGETMQIQFDTANRTTSGSGSFEIYWNDTLIDTVTSTGTTMQPKAYQVTAVAGNNSLRFKGLGTADGAGASIDNVRLFATTPVFSGGNMDISQTVGGRTAGEIMQVQFDTANRTTSASGSFEVYWNNTLIDTVTSTGTTMQPKAYQVTAVAGNNTLRFKGLGTADAAGASIDNVRLFATTPAFSGGNMDISQTVGGRTAGEIMQIKFDTANRTTSASGSMEVYWNNTLIDTVTSTGTTMQNKTYQVAAVAGNNTLRFKSIGTIDGAGASLDNIQLFATTPNVSGANMDISQAVTGLIAGQAMQLKFDHANRTTSASGSFEVYWNNALVATINSTGTTMTTETLNLTAVAGSNILRFKGTGTVDANGASLDNVRLVAMQQISGPLPGLADIRPLADPDNDVWTFNVYDAAQRLVQTIDGLGATSVLSYDGASRLVSTTSYANRVSAANLATLKARETNPNYWANANNGSWGVGNLSITAAGTVDGANAYQLSVITGGAWSGLVGNPIEAIAYDATTVTLSLKAVGGITTAEFGIYASLSAWGGNADSSAAVLSGPGAVLQHAGSLFYVMGLSTTVATRITISRSFTQAETLQPYLYIKTTDYNSVATGDSLIAAAPVQTFGHGSPVFLPAADSANDRVARSFYDNDGRLTGTLDAEGYLKKWGYDKAGRKIETIAYSAATNPALRASGTLAQLVSGIADNAEDAHNWFVYDARGLVRASVDSEGGLTRMSYNPLGELAYVETGQKLDPLALIATPPTLANLPSVPGGTVLQTVNYVRDAYGHVVSETRSLSGAATTTTAYSYDNMYRLTATTTQSGGPDTRVMRQRYDLRGNVVGTLNGIGSAALAALGGSPTQAQIDAVWADLGKTLTYDRADRLLSSTDPNGNRTLYYYDADGRLAFEIDPFGQVTGHAYDSHGRKTQVTVYETALASLAGMNGGDVTPTLLAAIAASASDTSVVTAYNADNTIKQVTDANGVVTTIAYNAFRETATMIEASGTGIARTTTYSYDRRSQLKTEVFDAGGGHKQITTTYGHDAFGRTITLTNALNKTATSTFDRKGRLKTHTVSPDGGTTLYTTTYHYDARDNLVAVTDANGATTRKVYDKAGRLIATIDARGGVSTITYDADGRAVVTRAYANMVSLGALPLEVTETALSLPSTSAADQITRFSYDKDGRLRFAIDGLMHVVESVYDQNSNVVRTIAYDGTIGTDGTGAYSESWVASQVSALAAAAGTRVARAVYDSANRVAYSIDALGQVAWSKYDRKGQVVKQVALAALYTATDDPSKSTMDSWLAANANATNDRTTRAWYDKAGQILYSADALGFVTRLDYDALGNVTKHSLYADAYAATDSTTLSNLNSAFASPPATTRITQFAYDTAGRLEQTTDPENYVTKLTLDAVGQVLTTTTAFGTAAASVTAYTYDDMGRMVKEVRASGAPEANTSWHYYDGLGQQTAVVDPGNYLSVMAYDEAGNLLTATRYANAITGSFGVNSLVTTLQALAGANANDTQGSSVYDAFGRATSSTDARGSVISSSYDVINRLVSQNQQMEAGSGDDRITSYAYDNFGNVEWITDPRGYQTHGIYDKLSRVIRQSNALYYHTDTTYTRGGGIASVKVWATAAAGHLPVGINPPSSAGDAVTTFTYNKRDELTATTDAMNYTESYTLNAFGERIEFRNKLHVAGTFDTTAFYTYNKRGLLLTETLPVATKTAGGATISVVNSYSYDARGNRTQMIEAAGAAEARTTNHAYDKLDRLTATTRDSVTVVNANLTSSTNVAVAETAVYDTRGNVIKKTNAAGAQTFFYYDHMCRTIAEIGPVGTLSVYGYDKNGNRTTVRSYDTAVSLPGSPGGAPPSGSGTSRLVTYAYDRSNRLTTTTVSGLQTGEYAAGAWSFTSTDIVSTIEYDMAGNVIHQEDGRGSDAYFWYDQLGRQIAQIDAENYLTTYQRDAEGNAVAETRYSSKITGSFTTATPAYGGLLALVTPNTALDRTTTFTYDANGRRTSERRWYVDASTVSVTGALGTSSQTAIVQYSYDGLGNVLIRTEANTDQTTYAYDKIGRLALETGQSFTDHLDASVAPRTAYAYDGLNNIRSVRLQAASTPNDTNDRITAYTYGAGGRLATMTDAAGFVHSYGYDVAGRLVRDSYVRTMSDGSNVTEAQVTRYDNAGRAITQTLARDTGSGWVFTNEVGTAYDAVRMDYNVHGELIGRGLTAGPDAAAVYQETFSYDLGGRLWKSNESDGVLRFFVYDKAGNKTLTLASTGDDLSGLTVSTYTNSIDGTGDTSLGSSVTAIATFDKRGQQLGLVEPDRQRTASGTATITRSNTYNAFGEVLTEVDGRGYTTTFSYNTMGRLASKVSPQVSITFENGAVSNTTPTENYYYDISGRLVGVRDANAVMDGANHTTTRLLLAGTGHGKDAEPLVLKEFHPDYNGTTGAVVTKYDVFGDARAQINEIGSTETRDFDKMGRVVVQYHPIRAAGSIGNPTGVAVQLIDYYAYDGFGQRIQHWNSQFTEYVKERTDYDAQGRVVSTVAFDGGTFTYAYAWNGGLTTSGMSAWGGWTKVTTNVAAGRSMTDVEDYFGHAIDQVDYGGHDYAFTYDWGGRLIARSNYSGESIGYSWYNTGLAAGQSGTQGVASYEYDANGNRTKETFSKGGLSYRDANATYDAMGRMTHWDDTGYGGYAPASSDWQYDAVGNVRSVSSNYRALDSQGNIAGSGTPQTYWYLYDNMNRFTLTKGTLTGTPGSGTVERGSEGTLISYYADGSRATALYTGQVYYTHWELTNPDGPPILPGPLEGGGGGETGYVWAPVTTTGPGDRREDYFYTADGYLAETRKADAWVDPGPDPSTNGGVPAEPVYHGPPAVGSLVSQTTRDALGRVTWYKEYGGFDGSFERTGITYDNAGRQLGETNFTIRRDTPGAISSTYKTIVANHYAGGVLTKSTQDTYKWDNDDDEYKDNALDDSLQTYSYAWWDGAVQSSIGNDKNWGGNPNSYSIDWTTAYTLDGSGHVSSVYIDDGRNRTVSFVVDQNGQIAHRDENDNTSGGDPRTLRYFFAGQQFGMVTNNGTDNLQYTAAVKDRLLPLATSDTGGAFRGGSKTAKPYADFEQSYDAINGYAQDDTASPYTVNEGDTLQSIALAVWGDSNLWYLIADANGLTNSSQLVTGQLITLPNKIRNNRNSADTFRPYDPNEALGNLSPTSPKSPKKPKCGVLGQIISVIVAAVTSQFGILGNVVSQGVNMLLGIQDKFSWKSLGMAAITSTLQAFTPPGMSGLAAFAFNVGTNIVAQGIGVVTGLQKKFDWAGVAGSAIASGIQLGLSSANLPSFSLSRPTFEGFAASLGTRAFTSVFKAAARTAIDGTSFGDNIVAELPDVIGGTIGGALSDWVGNKLASRFAGEPSVTVSTAGASPVPMPTAAVMFYGFGAPNIGEVSLASDQKGATSTSQSAYYAGATVDDQGICVGPNCKGTPLPFSQWIRQDRGDAARIISSQIARLVGVDPNNPTAQQVNDVLVPALERWRDRVWEQLRTNPDLRSGDNRRYRAVLDAAIAPAAEEERAEQSRRLHARYNPGSSSGSSGAQPSQGGGQSTRSGGSGGVAEEGGNVGSSTETHGDTLIVDNPPNQDIQRPPSSAPARNNRVTNPDAANGSTERVGGTNPDGVGGKELMNQAQRDAFRAYMQTVGKRYAAAAAGAAAGAALGYVLGGPSEGVNEAADEANRPNSPQPNPTPTPTPVRPVPPLPYDQIDDEIRNSPVLVVADSNVFMDRIEGKTSRAIFDGVLNNDEILMLMPEPVKAEIHPSPTQDARVARAGTRLIETPSSLHLIPNVDSLRSGKFGWNDIDLMETALISRRPVITSNEAMENQIRSDRNSAVFARYGRIAIWVPGRDFHSADQLRAMLKGYSPPP